MADKSLTPRELAAKLHSANSRVVTANDQTTSPISRYYALNDASALIKEVISVLMEGETDYFGNVVTDYDAGFGGQDITYDQYMHDRSGDPDYSERDNI